METRGVANLGRGGLRLRSVAVCLSALFASVTALADGDTSDPALVYLRPETSSFWHTATNSTMTLPVEFPVGASSATLTVTGAFNYSQTINDITSSSVTVALPEAVMPENDPATEDVYDFTLTFNDGTVRTAKLGLIAGLGDGEGQTRCLAPASGSAWEKVKGQVAIPIPYGMTSFEINGTSTDTGLDGAQGWYVLKLKSNVSAALSGLVGEDSWTALLKGAATGFFLILR
ncbi:MAG: hypothetical protein IJG18_09520 [Kiritimatiellae bacterium]|nr:hypothetical protein [Kiritimatiellia bacterium]